MMGSWSVDLSGGGVSVFFVLGWRPGGVWKKCRPPPRIFFWNSPKNLRH